MSGSCMGATSEKDRGRVTMGNGEEESSPWRLGREGERESSSGIAVK